MRFTIHLQSYIPTKLKISAVFKKYCLSPFKFITLLVCKTNIYKTAELKNNLTYNPVILT